MKDTLSVVYIIRNDEEFLRESLLSIDKIADEIIIVLDKRSNDGTRQILQDMKDERYKIIEREWDCGAKQKDFAVKQATKDWILCMDGDEVLSDNAEILKDYMARKDVNSYDIQGHHFIYHLGLEDATFDEHFWMCKLVRNNGKICFEGNNHALMAGWDKPIEKITDVRVLHFGYVKHLHKIMCKYNLDMKTKQIHSQRYIDGWKDAHIFGKYPIKLFNVADLPETICKKFRIDKDKIYFKNRGLQLNHWIDVYTWKKYFKLGEKDATS